MKKLIFLSNELLAPNKREKMKLPLTFISFAYVEGKMIKYKDTTMVFSDQKKWGNNRVYGALFILDDFEFHIRVLDAMHVCSLSRMYRNHKLDLHHRVLTEVTPIFFDSISQFTRLKYREIEKIKVYAFFGNSHLPKISKRLHGRNSYRIKDGIDKENFKKLLNEREGEK